MDLFSKKKELDLLNADEVAKSPTQKFVPFVFAGLTIVAVLALYGFVFMANIAAQGGLDKAKEDVNSKTAQWQTFKETATNIKDIQTKYSQYIKFVSTYSLLDKKIEKLKKILPKGVYLTNLTIDNAGKTVLSGSSAIPEDVYQFRDVLLSDKEISAVTLTAVAKSGLSYTFSIGFNIDTK